MDKNQNDRHLYKKYLILTRRSLYFIASVIIGLIYFKFNIGEIYKCNSIALGKVGDLSTGELWWNWMVSNKKITSVDFFTSTHFYANYPLGEEFFPLSSVNQITRRVLIYSLVQFFGFICAENIFIVLGIILTTFVTCLLLDIFQSNALVNFILSVSYSLSPYFFTQVIDHPAFTHNWIYSLCLLLILKRQKESIIDLRLVFFIFFVLFWDQYTFVGVIVIVLTCVLVKFRKEPNFKKYLFAILLSVSAVMIIINSNRDQSTFLQNILIRDIAEINSYNLNPIYFLVLNSNSYFLKWLPFDYIFQSDNFPIGIESVHFSLLTIFGILILVLKMYFMQSTDHKPKSSLKSTFGRDTRLSNLYSILIVINIIIPILVYLLSRFEFPIYLPIRVITRYMNISALVLLLLLALLIQKLNVRLNGRSNDHNILIPLLMICQILFGIPVTKHTINYSDYPKIFDYIRQSSDIKSIILFSKENLMPNFQSYQPIFQKPLLNSSFDPKNLPSGGAVAIADPNSLNIVKSLNGTHMLIKENDNDFTISNYLLMNYPNSLLSEEIFTSKSGNSDLNGKFSLFERPNSKSANFYIRYVDGFFPPEIDLYSGRWVSKEISNILVSSIKSNNTRTNATLIAGLSSNQVVNLEIIQGGKVLFRGDISKAITEIKINVKLNKKITIKSSRLYELNPPFDNRIGSIFVSSMHATGM